MLKEIHDSFMNGQTRQAVEKIDSSFMMYDFWSLYLDYLRGYYPVGLEGIDMVLRDFSDAVISYHRIKNR